MKLAKHGADFCRPPRREAFMKQTISRRRFVTLGATAALATSTRALAGAEAETANKAGAKPPIVRLDLLTSREVGEWMKSNDVIFVPHGPISGHGPWTTLGVQTHGAEAVATLLARKCDCVGFPPIFTCFAGSSRTYPGIVPFSSD